ncbi:major facilitator superfamily domain-containing protein [Flagelloscypha sp. PMI_526]|nr:major facilitator superfamily domain-containing protein [Flagelloscypha sp. PMI_526]
MSAQRSLQADSPNEIPQDTNHDSAAVLNEKDISNPAEETLNDDINSAPDGGLRAWMVVFGAFLSGLSTFGLINSWGVFQSYYETTVLPDTNVSSIAWIGSVQYAMLFIPALVTGRIFDLGYLRGPHAFWSAMLVLSIFLTAQCSQYWQFLLCQGFAQGLSAGMLFSPTLIVGQWFQKKRGLAMGITALGSSTGGTVFPILSRGLIPLIGLKWTMRTIAIIIFLAMFISNLTFRRRLPPRKIEGGLIDLTAFKNPVFAVYCLSQFVTFLGLYTVLTYIDVSATFVGIPADFSFYLVSMANAGSAVGRLMGGYLVDKIGVINLIAPTTMLTAVFTFIWPFIKTKGGFVALAIPYGITSGTFISTFMLPLYSMGAMEDMGRRQGMVSTIVAMGALAGPPISGAIYEASGGYVFLGVYAGSITLLSVMLLLLTRYLALGGSTVSRWRGKF